VRVLTAAEGGRRTAFGSGYRPQFHVRTADATGGVDLGPVHRAAPGDVVDAEITLGVPLALTPGLRFAVREGGRTVATGTVTRVLD
jgi:elongation factor Tu